MNDLRAGVIDTVNRSAIWAHQDNDHQYGHNVEALLHMVDMAMGSIIAGRLTRSEFDGAMEALQRLEDYSHLPLPGKDDDARALLALQYLEEIGVLEDYKDPDFWYHSTM